MCARVRGVQTGCAQFHKHTPRPLPCPPIFFPYREVYFARVVPQYWMFLLKISRRALFFFHLETYTGNVLGQLRNTHTHTHTWRQDVFPASLEGWQTRERGGGEGGGGRLHADLPLESLPDAACGQARFQFENLPACLPPWNLQPVIANNATT